MARTSRTAAPNNVAALDNIDLDDMFTEGADDLFEGLGIDIDMDEIDTTTTTAATEPQHHSAAASAPKATPKNKSTKSQSKLSTASSLVAATTNEGATGTASGPSVATSRSRRKTKRKILEEDDDDSYEEPQTKKTKRKPAKRKGQTKKASEPTSSILASFAKQRPTATAASMPLTKAPQLMAQHPKSSTAASTSSSILPNNGGSLKRKAPPRTGATPSASQHCGIAPSNTVFYPFLDLPNEFLLKSKKPFPTVDKVHTAFQSQLQQQQQQPQQPPAGTMKPPPTNDPLIRLLQDGKLDAETVSRAVTAMRSTLTPASTSIADWHNIARILQRQHDFLQQSAANMQAWCRNNYTEAEFADVYSGTVLRSFPTPHIKVKILLGKDKNKALLPATLPTYIVRNPTATATSTTTSASRTTKASTSKASSSSTTTTSRPKPVASVPQPPTPYTHLCSAAARRKAIADRLSQVAPLAAAATPASTTPHYRPMVLPSLPTTLSMWKWLEHTGYWGTNPRVARAARVDPWTVPTTKTTTTTPLKPLAVEERLQSLLVEQEYEDSSSAMDEEDDDDILDTYDNDCMESSSALLDASALSTEERWRWVLQRAGWEPLAADDTATSATAVAGSTEVEDMIHTMMEDLHATDGSNNQRLRYLEAAAAVGDDKKTRQQETALMAKCQQLLIKKSKEKAKAAVVTKRDDDIQLPW